MLLVKKDTIWVKWIHEAKLKGGNLWTAKCEKSASHGWKQILSLREKDRGLIMCQVGNGDSIFLCHDKWWGTRSFKQSYTSGKY